MPLVASGVLAAALVANVAHAQGAPPQGGEAPVPPASAIPAPPPVPPPPPIGDTTPPPDHATDRGPLVPPAKKIDVVPPPTTTAAAPLATSSDTPATDFGTRGQVGGGRKADVFAEDWWNHSRPLLELHGFYRVRAELFQNFALGRNDNPTTALWPRPIDDTYVDAQGTTYNNTVCQKDPGGGPGRCNNKTQSSANMRLRLDPEIHVSDNLRILTQIDLLDNVVLGSAPASFGETSTGGTGVGANPYSPRSISTTTTSATKAGSGAVPVAVKRAWGEYLSPVGLLRFGRMPNQFGLGIYSNAGDGFDSDWQSTVDRLQFVTGVPALDLYVSLAWDFANEGAISARQAAGGQPYDLGQLDDVGQYSATIARRRDPELAKQDLAHGKFVLDGGAQVFYRNQYLANDSNGSNVGQGQNYTTLQNALTRRGANIVIPDLWAKLRYRKFRFEAEVVTVQGAIDSTVPSGNGTSNYLSNNTVAPNGFRLRQWTAAIETDYRAVEDKLRVGFGWGWASGDGDLATLKPSGSLPTQIGPDRTYSLGTFHPDYRVDLILFRNILQSVQGAYYFRPSVDYDFIRNVNGQKVGGGAAAIWSRASEFVSTPGHHRDLGVELDLQGYYQSKDGSLNDDPTKMGGFYTSLQFGILFPLAGLNYQQGEKDRAPIALDTSTALIFRWNMGILF